MSSPEQIQKFEEMVAKWQDDKSWFPTIIEFALKGMGFVALDNQLACKLEVAESTVLRWAIGIARPHPKLQEQVIEAIRSMI